MRSLLLLALAACSTPGWTTYESITDKTRPAVLADLRRPEGDATLVAGDRCYLVRAEVLRPEIRAFTSALAEAIESDRVSGPDPSPAPTASDPVIALPWLDRALNVGRLRIESIRTDRGVDHRISVELEPERHVGIAVRGTPKSADAWEKLARAAHAQAVTWYMAPVGPNVNRYVRDALVDVGSASRPSGAASP